MVDAVLEHLITDVDGIYLDGTAGFGGHASAIIQKLCSSGIYIGLDADPYALEYTKKRLSVHKAFCTLFHVNYRNFPEVLASLEVSKVTGLFFDIGISSYQINSRDRGFSFRSNSKLDMRFDYTSGKSAKEFLNEASVEEIGKIIRDFGQEKNWKRIASKINYAVKKGQMETTFHLRSAIESVTHNKFLIKTMARVFQAIRIHVNDELGALKIALESSIKYLKPGGRIGVISFHSLEDRLIKKFFKMQSIECTCPRDIPICACYTKPNFKLVTKKAIIPSDSEISLNPRSRSAKLRFAERI